MLTVQQLIEASKDDRLQRLPQYARTLVHDLARRMEAEHLAAQAVRERAAEEVTAARAIAAEGPADSDTFLDLPRALYSDEEDEQRPLGRGANIEFRADGDGEGEGYSVRIENGELVIHGINRLAIVPQDHMTLRIVRR